MQLRLFRSPDRKLSPLVAGNLTLRHPSPDDYAAWRQLRAESAAFLIPWEPRWPADDLTRAGYRRRLVRYRAEAVAGSGFTYFLFSVPDGKLLGGLSLSNIRMGAARSAAIGYWMGERHAGKGYMKRAVAMIVSHAFKTLDLARVEAACIPGNERSTALLEHVGFSREGIMRSYLEIDGHRRDHVLFAMLREDSDSAQLGAIAQGAVPGNRAANRATGRATDPA